MESKVPQRVVEHIVQIPAGPVRLEGVLSLPEHAKGIVIFAHGSGSSRHSPRNRLIAEVLQQAGLATLLMDLLTLEEETIDQQTGQHRFDIKLLARRLVSMTDWLARSPATRSLTTGYFGAGTGAAAALVAAVERPDVVSTVVARGGRLDLAGAALGQVLIPTLLIVGSYDVPALELTQKALPQLKGVKRLEIVPGARHFFEEPGALEVVARLARDWFLRYLASSPQQSLSFSESQNHLLAEHP